MATTKKLPKVAVTKIERAVDQLFNRAKTRLLGAKWGDKSFAVTYERHASLPGLYEAAHREEKGIPDHEQLDHLMVTAANYIDSLRHRAKARTIQHVRTFMADAKEKGVDTNVETVLGGQLADLWGDITAQFKRIVDTEAQHVRSVGVVDGIVRSNASLGIEDPVVFFVVVRDQHLCDECKRLHLLKNGRTPRVYKLSDVAAGYHKKGESEPKIGGLHPHCRCSMTTLLPGFGFGQGGEVTYKGEGHDEYDRQAQFR